MTTCVVGAGAMGGLIAARLAAAGEPVTVIARGPHLAAIRARGLRLQDAAGEQVAAVRATDRLEEAGPHDLVLLAMKAHQLVAVAPEVHFLMGPDTTLVTAQNGIPFWYFQKHGGPHQGKALQSVDPGGIAARHLPVERIVGSILYPAAEIASPGLVRHVEGDRITLGELDGTETPRLRALVELLRRAGFKARVAKDLRAEIWVKLWGNCTFNPLSALTHATLAGICSFPATRALAAAMMREAQQVGEALGVRFGVTLEKRIAGAESVGAHKTSMLQDVEAGRPIELEALLGSVIELAALTGTPAPNLQAIHACAGLLARTLQEQKGRLAIQRG